MDDKKSIIDNKQKKQMKRQIKGEKSEKGNIRCGQPIIKRITTFFRTYITSLR